MSPITIHPERGGVGPLYRGGEYVRKMDSVLEHVCLYMRGACYAEGDEVAGAEYGTGEVEDAQLGAAGS